LRHLEQVQECLAGHPFESVIVDLAAHAFQAQAPGVDRGGGSILPARRITAVKRRSTGGISGTVTAAVTTLPFNLNRNF
jgi:hypothetical protein